MVIYSYVLEAYRLSFTLWLASWSMLVLTRYFPHGRRSRVSLRWGGWSGSVISSTSVFLLWSWLGLDTNMLLIELFYAFLLCIIGLVLDHPHVTA